MASLEPVFVKADLQFSLDGHDLRFAQQNISLFGVSGLIWDPLSPEAHFGKQVQLKIELVLGERSFAIEVPGYLMREYALNSQSMGIRFKLTPQQATLLSAAIKQRGSYPTEYIRKYPRLPSSKMIQTFPLRAIVTTVSQESNQWGAASSSTPVTLVCDVGNLSPNGALLFTENQSSLSILPPQKIDVTFEPRGWFPMPIRVQGTVCRVSDDLSAENGNLIRYIGLKFTRIEEADRGAFLNLLRDILEKMKEIKKPD